MMRSKKRHERNDDRMEKINRREEAELNRQESMNSMTACE